MRLHYILLILFFLLPSNSSYGQRYSAFPEDAPKPWGGLGIAVPDVAVAFPIQPRTIPFVIRPQVDFGIFQPHGYVVRGGKFTLAYQIPFTTIGLGATYVGGLIGYNVDRSRDEGIFAETVVSEREIFMWGGILGEMVELLNNVFIMLEIRFLSQDVNQRIIIPTDFSDPSSGNRFITTWMIGLNVLFW